MTAVGGPVMTDHRDRSTPSEPGDSSTFQSLLVFRAFRLLRLVRVAWLGKNEDRDGFRDGWDFFFAWGSFFAGFFSL